MPERDSAATVGAWAEGIGPCTRLVVAVTMAGSLVAGGGVVALLAYLSPGAMHLLPGIVPVLFAAGALAGFFHGTVLAWFARPQPCGHGGFRTQVIRAAEWSLPGLAISALVAIWTAYTTTLASAGQGMWLVAVAGGWVLGAVICVWASVEAWRALRLTVARWPEHRAGLVLLALTFGALLLVLADAQVRVLGLEFRLTLPWAVPVAFALTLWLAAPVEVLLLHAFRRRYPAAGN